MWVWLSSWSTVFKPFGWFKNTGWTWTAVEVFLTIKTNLYRYHIFPPLFSFSWKTEDFLVFVFCLVLVGLASVCLLPQLVISLGKFWILPLQWQEYSSNFQKQHIHINFSFVKIIFNYKHLPTCDFFMAVNNTHLSFFSPSCRFVRQTDLFQSLLFLAWYFSSVSWCRLPAVDWSEQKILQCFTWDSLHLFYPAFPHLPEILQLPWNCFPWSCSILVIHTHHW